MDFYSFNDTIIPAPKPYDDAYTMYFVKGVLVGVYSMAILWTLSNMMNWCKDPLATHLKKTIDVLGDENDKLRDSNDALFEKVFAQDRKRRKYSSRHESEDSETSIDERLPKVD